MTIRVAVLRHLAAVDVENPEAHWLKMVEAVGVARYRYWGQRSRDLFADLRMTRAWFAARASDWTPAQRVRRAMANQAEPWAE